MQTSLENDKIAELKKYISDISGKTDKPESYLIAVLHRAQNLFGYLNREVMDEIAVIMNIPASHIWGVATFYHYFKLKPQGRHSISICLGTACYVKGAGNILEAVKKELGIGLGETTEDGLFSLHEARCLGACGLAPVVMIDDKIYGELTTQKITEIISGYRKSNRKSKEG
ncbi:MAG: NADH-quinone oxidoreductase subunit NuoE [bacterium]|nr:NADH-quinone oxidoreductase subunit NuoE [bacterium]